MGRLAGQTVDFRADRLAFGRCRKAGSPRAAKVAVAFALSVDILLSVLPAPCHPQSDPGGESDASAADVRRLGIESKRRHDDYEQFALMHRGDARQGQSLFVDVATRCSLCHRVDGSGGDVGPDLSHIGSKFDRVHLIESLLEPSRQIVEGYRQSLVVLSDGRVVVGVVKNQSPDRVTIADVSGATHVLRRQEIDEMLEDRVSAMPEGLVDSLNTEQFCNLVAYLESLRSSGSPTPGEGNADPLVLPNGFEAHSVATGLTGCTALETLPDGRVLVCEQTGALRVVKAGKLLPAPFVTLDVDDRWERGLIGVTVDPKFPAVPYVYVCYIARQPYPHHRVSRFTAAGDVARPGSEIVLLRGDDQDQLGGNVPAGHQGGALHFGADGCLYVSIGEQTAGMPAQSLSSLLGKILRIRADGTIPSDNPFFHRTKRKYRAIWARGLRNPFTFAIQPGSGLMLVNDVGGQFEEINPGVAGANFGWPTVNHGPSALRKFANPIHVYPESSIAGGAFLPPGSPWPSDYRERYFFADFVLGQISTLDPNDATHVSTFATGLRRPTDLRFGADHCLYVLQRNAWVRDDKFAPGTGSLLRIEYRSPADAGHRLTQ